jgi:uncharacterized protein YukE
MAEEIRVSSAAFDGTFNEMRRIHGQMEAVCDGVPHKYTSLFSSMKGESKDKMEDCCETIARCLSRNADEVEYLERILREAQKTLEEADLTMATKLF